MKRRGGANWWTASSRAARVVMRMTRNAGTPRSSCTRSAPRVRWPPSAVSRGRRRRAPSSAMRAGTWPAPATSRSSVRPARSPSVGAVVRTPTASCRQPRVPPLVRCLRGRGAGGVVAGIAGGLALLLLPGSQATPAVLVALGLIGGTAGALGAAGVGAGLAAAEALARSQRTMGLVSSARPAGRCRACSATASPRRSCRACSGRAGRRSEAAWRAWCSARRPASATRRRRPGLRAAEWQLRTAGTAGGRCAPDRRVLRVACAGLAVLDRHLVAASLDVVAHRFTGASVGLAPIARLLGEQELRPITRTVVSAFEGFMFGAGLVLGLTRRPEFAASEAGVRTRPRAAVPPGPASHRHLKARSPSAHVSPTGRGRCSPPPRRGFMPRGARAVARQEGPDDGSPAVRHCAHLRARHCRLGLARRLPGRPYRASSTAGSPGMSPRSGAASTRRVRRRPGFSVQSSSPRRCRRRTTRDSSITRTVTRPGIDP